MWRIATWAIAVSTGGALLLAPFPAQAKKRGEDRFISGARQLTYDGRRSGECYFSPDGKQLVFMSEREPGNPFFQIYVLDLETGDIDRVSPGNGKATCPYFQKGTGILEFASTHLDPDFADKAAAEYKRREEGEIMLGLFRWENGILVRLRDFAPSVDPSQVKPPGHDDLQPGGLGIRIIEAVMDNFEFLAVPGGQGNLLQMTKRRE